MPSATMTSKGQVTIPKSVRDAMGVDTGSILDFTPDGQGFRVTARSGSIVDLFGLLPPPVRTASLEDMDAGIAQAAAETMRT